MSASHRGFSLLELLVTLAIVGILTTLVAVPRYDSEMRRHELAISKIIADVGEALWRSRLGEVWYLAWTNEELRLWRPDQQWKTGCEQIIAAPSGMLFQELSLDGQVWPRERPVALAGFATPPLRLELSLPGRNVVLRSLPTGRIERIAESIKP